MTEQQGNMPAGIHTSASDPIPLGLIDGKRFGLPGRFGMTYAPGKQGERLHGGAWRRDIEQDLSRLKGLGVDTMACLVEPFELDMLGIPDLPAKVAQHGMAFLTFPIVDHALPADIEAFHAFVVGLCERVTNGETVVVHCRGGRGRTGLVTACCLVNLGVPGAEAIAMVRKARPETIETGEQEAYVAVTYPKFLAGRPKTTGAP